MEKRWQIKQPDPESVAHLRRRLDCHPLIATLLVNRDITSADDAKNFLCPSLSDLREPFSIVDIQLAAGRIASALENGEKILLFGDYDVDGVTATAILFEFLEAAGGNVSYYIPHRIREGYGLAPAHINRLAASEGVSLVVTVDCGSASHEAALAARKAGIDLVITDHHEIPGSLPQALAVVNPKRSDCSAGFEHLAGVGVAFSLLISLRKHLRESGFWKNREEPNLKNACDLVALGTVADMVPLVAENRILTRVGLEVMSSGRRPGINALAAVSRIAGRPISGEDIAFRLAPRINAAGRMDSALKAVELLTAASEEAAGKIARTLQQFNTRRQETEKEVLDEILSSLEDSPELAGRHSLVLAGTHWHEGVIGIVASRLVKIFHRPVVLAAIRDGLARGSARGIPGLDLYGLLSGCSDLLESFGGHTMAAGLKIKPRKFDRLKDRFEAQAASALGTGEQVPTVDIDCKIGLETITGDLIDAVERLQPFGQHNPEPLFMATDVAVLSTNIVGKCHRRMVLGASTDRRGPRFQSIHFNIDPEHPPGDTLERVAFRLGWNRWNGRKTAQMIIEET